MLTPLEIELLAVAKQAAEGIAHVRRVKAAGTWSEDQISAFMNGIEQSARVAIAKADSGSLPAPAGMAAVIRDLRSCLGDWVEIAEDEDQRARDWDALDAADAMLATLDGKPAPAPLDRPDIPARFINHYRCTHESREAYESQAPAEWVDEWSCTCNDRCPVCNAEVEPYESEEV